VLAPQTVWDRRKPFQSAIYNISLTCADASEIVEVTAPVEFNSQRCERAYVNTILK
jgi:hypothetical protein